MPRTVRLLFATALCALALPTAAARAATPITTYFNAGSGGACPAYGDLNICSGEVPSWDGTLLDVDLTMPMNGTGGTRHPLIVMLNGFGADKHEWESTTDTGDDGDKYRWNSHWFAEHGYYVLTYTPRGFDSTLPPPYSPPTPSGTSRDTTRGTIRVKSKEYEIRDTQWLAALVAAGYSDVNRDQLAVTGGSYGGGESWLQASQAQWSFPNSKDPTLPVLQLQVSVPKYGWTDLAYSLFPNGHPGNGPGDNDIYRSSQGSPASDTGDGNPIGVLKNSFFAELSGIGADRGTYETGAGSTDSAEGPYSIPAWGNRLSTQGDPYSPEDATVRQLRRGFTEFRSSYYQQDGWAAQAPADKRKVAIYAIQGWTDDLFPAVEAFRQYKYLKALDPQWPINVVVADVGHGRAQNKPDTWHTINNNAFGWLQDHIGGSHDQITTITAEPTTCPNDMDPDNNVSAATEMTATTPEGLSAGKLTIRALQGDDLESHQGADDPDGPATDPLPIERGAFEIGPVGSCRASSTPTSPGRYTAVSQELPDTNTYIGLGEVDIPYRLTGDTATVNARVWDVGPSGNTLLMTRGTYRIDTAAGDPPSGTARLPLFGNHWQIRPHHKVRLDITLVDQPFLRPATPESTVHFDPPTLKLPLRESSDRFAVAFRTSS